ncbi:hypothetical protein SNOG_11477 [Parastagonospora nodorum SN15]|uniref:Uncharacterized protein n=1 Tax=Phaeosphaeria nodorum (strain SN15 / ATCC MYA-4574 / FGSC 10173) TaxID=321614 RepID=Q0U9T7_PHANO|nr:hypothetical protein SNOG_11477 [Parastagonospora nodorum SN15]EAT81185.1 hypothetical protein SNOG_11477 [Parastagonospora nodorum SN15]
MFTDINAVHELLRNQDRLLLPDANIRLSSVANGLKFVRHAPTAKVAEDALIRDNVGTRCGSPVAWKDAVYPASRPRHRDVKIDEIEVAANIVLYKEQMTWKDGSLGIRLRHDEIS